MKTICNMASSHTGHVHECQIVLNPGGSETVEKADVGAKTKEFVASPKNDALLPGFNESSATMNGKPIDKATMANEFASAIQGGPVKFENKSQKRVCIAFRCDVVAAKPKDKAEETVGTN